MSYNDESFLESKDPNKQDILDYMHYHGICIRKHVLFYYLDASELKNSQEFMKLTNYHVIIAESIVHIKENPPYGSVKSSFSSLSEAFDALKYLYDIIVSTESDADF